MNRIVFAMLLGGFLGVFDGLSALVSAPETRPDIVGIVIGSTIKGIITGLLIGLFARKFGSMPLGIAFGLVVGTALAFLISMQTGYYWQIMLPGAILGVVVGFATYRFGRPAAAVAAAAVLFFGFAGIATAGVPAKPSEKAAAKTATVAAPDGKAAFEKLKALAGSWDGNIMTPGGPPARVSYRVTGGGTAVMEVLFEGTPHEMTGMYHMDGTSLVMTHYCAAGNQPKLKLVSASERELLFDFVGGSNVDPKTDMHAHGAVLKLVDARTLEQEWTFWQGGKAADSKRFYLKRAAAK